MTTLFALLFWDVLFARVSSVFVTEFQTAPLDLAEDTFYSARKDLIERRLAELLEEGKALEILRRNDKFYRETKTFCIGLSWTNCSAPCSSWFQIGLFGSSHRPIYLVIGEVRTFVLPMVS